MCLIAFAWQSHPRYPLLLIGNRDEFHARPATAAGPQPDAPHVYGGRDLEKQGSWLQVSSRRRLATVTNVREGLQPEPARRSRGALVADCVRSTLSASDWLGGLLAVAPEYGRFNLLAWDGRELMLAGNHPSPAQRTVAPGVHGLSNGAFDAPWPKVRMAQAALAHWIAQPVDVEDPDTSSLFAALGSERVAADAELPDTGVGLELERLLSPAFIRGSRYGTRCSSVVLVGNEEIVFDERRFGPDGVPADAHRARIALA
jgi:uncharacterized protein with NRDE domain